MPAIPVPAYRLVISRSPGTQRAQIVDTCINGIFARAGAAWQLAPVLVDDTVDSL